MRKIIALCAVCIVLIAAVTMTGCLGNKPYDSQATVNPRGAADDSIPTIPADQMSELLSNPDRGLRMETYITLGDPLQAYPTNNEDPFQRAIDMIEKYRSDSPTLCQVYVYLTNYVDKPLDALALEQLERFFTLMRDNGIRMLLRFAYQTESVPDADYARMQNHLATLDTFFTEHADLIAQTVYALQLGMIGYWGEGHSFQAFDWKHHSNDLVKDMCEFARKHNLYLQVRTMDLYSKVPLKYRDIVGMHDDYVIDNPDDPWAFLPASDWRYKSTMRKFSKTINDGEMPWGDAKLGDQDDGASLNSMDGKVILQRIAQNSMTSFSLEHNYREKENAQFSMYKWRDQYMTWEECDALGIPANKKLFDVNGGKLSIYEILRQHLGYQLALSNYVRNSDVLEFRVTNYGFAAPLKATYFALVTVENGQYTEHPIEAYDPLQLVSGNSVRYRIRVPSDAEVVGVKLALSASSELTVRFANGTPYKDGVQYFA